MSALVNSGCLLCCSLQLLHFFKEKKKLSFFHPSPWPFYPFHKNLPVCLLSVPDPSVSLPYMTMSFQRTGSLALCHRVSDDALICSISRDWAPLCQGCARAGVRLQTRPRAPEAQGPLTSEQAVHT